MTLLALAGCATPQADEPTYRPAAAARAIAPPRAAAGDAPSARTATALTLADCQRLAAGRSRRIEIASLRAAIAEERATGELSRVLPRLDAGGQILVRNNNPGFQFPSALPGFGASGFVAGDKEVPSAHASAIVPIYDFGASWSAIAAARGHAEAAGDDVERARQDLALDVAVGYFRVLEAEKIRLVVVDSIAAVERQLAEARDALAQGVVARNEVLTVEVDLAARREELIRAESNIELAKAVLARAMGVDVTAPLEVVDVLEEEPWTGSFEAALAEAVDRRPDLASLRAEIEASRAEWRAARDDFFPKLYAFGNYEYVGDSYQLHPQWVEGGLGVSIPIFDGFQRAARLLAAEKAIAASVAAHDERADDVVLEVKRAWLSVREAAARIPVARGGVAQAEENLRVIRDRYGHGLLTSAEVLLEEDRLSRARSSLYQALYDEREAFARLEHAVGARPARPGGE